MCCSDLAFESTESHIPEFRHWLADLRNLAAYIWSSNIWEEDIRLHVQNRGREQEVKRFPMHHRNRNEGTENPVQQHSEDEAIGFTKLEADLYGWWSPEPALTVQKEAQRTFITMADLLKQRDQIIKSVDFMLEGTYPGGQEDKHQPQHSEQASNEDDPPPSKRAKFNSLVTTSISFESVRKEVILCAWNFEEQNEQVTTMIALANADNAKEMIAAGHELTYLFSAMCCPVNISLNEAMVSGLPPNVKFVRSSVLYSSSLKWQTTPFNNMACL